ncbi:MAG: xanthan lyase [Bacteroidaceae bacterium]|nr:xanthan lyase [Bacteroidaceae bacterium]
MKSAIYHSPYTIPLRMVCLTSIGGAGVGSLLKRTSAFMIVSCLAIAASAQTLRGSLFNYLDNYTRTDQKIKPSTLDSLKVDAGAHTVKVYVGGGFKEQFFTDSIVGRIYADIRSFMPDSLADYNLSIITDRHNIETLVPNALRAGSKSDERIWTSTYTGTPWVKNVSVPWSAPLGLDGRHIALWQSHGNYWNPDKQEWMWQRPRLFCTTEDLFTQTFVIPYIIPMLENAGAIVYDTRERNWQNHEVIVDNDAPQKDGRYDEDGRWHTADSAGFAHLKDIYYTFDNPFRDGTSRYASTTQQERPNATCQWMPDIPADGEYAVYVSYQTTDESIADACYTVTHRGVETQFHVNQKMGGNTWVYLGTFRFSKGCSAANMVTLSNRSTEKGVVSADGVRFGGGMGNIARANDYVSKIGEVDAPSLFNYTTSHLPRWAEAARYSSQWAGMPDTIYNHMRSDNDYNNDLWTRPETVNTLAGGSIYLPTRQGRHVPLELAMAFHSDAGFSATGDKIGSLAICTALPEFYDCLTAAGTDRFASYDLASMMLEALSRDMKKYNWQVRTLWNRNYCETREPQVPSVILEMLSHQNFYDLRLGYDPHFKFDFCRTIYKTILRYLATMHNTQYVVQPLPVHSFAITLNNQGRYANLTWNATDDLLEPSARPDRYVVYTRVDDGDFDNGRITTTPSMLIELEAGHVYSFRVCAANDGGISFPSEVLCAYSAPQNAGTILIVNAFNRLSGPMAVDTPAEQGFNLDADPGVPYGAFAGYCGRQLVFDTTHMGSEATNGTGYSGSELEGQIMMGNTFDYVSLHGCGIAQLRNHSFCSCSEEALNSAVVIPSEYQMIDIIYGVEKELSATTQTLIDDYLSRGGRLLMSGSQSAHTQHVGEATLLTDLSLDSVNGSGLDFTIYRAMNSESYAVPVVRSLPARGEGAFVMLQYSDHHPAAVAYDGADYKSITIGFPIESIREAQKRDLLMQAIVNFLCR